MSKTITDDTVVKLMPPREGSELVKTRVNLGPLNFKFTFDLCRPTSRFIYDMTRAGMLYEPEATVAIIGGLKAGDTFFDVGANCGWFSAIAALLVGESGRVVSFEPSAENCELLKRNLNRGYVIEAAVTDHRAGVDLFINEDNDGGHALWPCGNHPHNNATRAAGNPTRSVRSVVLDDYAGLSPSVIKCDTEGAEWHVMNGARKILAGDLLRVVILENNGMGLDELGSSPDAVCRLMAEYGFKDTAESGDPSIVGNWIFKRQ